MSLKLTIFIRDNAGYGWAENFFYNGGTTGPQFTFNLQQLFNGRAAILTNSSLITHARIDSGVKRNPLIISIAAGAGKPGAETPPQAPSEVALLCRFSAAATTYLRPFLRGIPERVVQSDFFQPDGTFMSNLNSFFTTLKSGNWNAQGFLGSSPNPFPITNLTPVLPRGWKFQTALTSPFVGTLGQKIRIHGAKVPGYNGIKVLTAVDNTAHQYTVGGASPAAPDTAIGAFLTQLTLQDAVITDCLAEGLSRRGAGRPFGLSRGRKQTLYSLRQ